MKKEDEQELCKKHGIVYFITEGCIRCNRESARGGTKKLVDAQFKQHLKKSYGIKAEEYEGAWTEQKGLCASCKGQPGKRRMSCAKGLMGKLYLVCSRCDVVVRTGKNNAAAIHFVVDKILD